MIQKPGFNRIFLTSAVVIATALSHSAFAEKIMCKDLNFKEYEVPSKTLTIKNNSNKTIYPIIQTSGPVVNEWLQGCFRTTEPYRETYAYRLYVNGLHGLESGQTVTLSLPLFSKTTLGTATWWNGGRVFIGDEKDYPDGVEALYQREQSHSKSVPVPADVICTGCQTMEIFAGTTGERAPDDKSVAGLPDFLPGQLTEFTFGDSYIPVGQNVRFLNPNNVNYNISYVDHVYLPVAMGPKGNPYIGYTGSTKSINEFQDKINHFLKTDGIGWPLYNLSGIAGKKLPGAYNVFKLKGDLKEGTQLPLLTPEGKNGSVHRMRQLWKDCVSYFGQGRTCPNAELEKDLNEVNDFFSDNYDDYKKLFSTGICTLDPGITEPVPLTPEKQIANIYGWVPYNQGCGAGRNPLAGDTDESKNKHYTLQTKYINELQRSYKKYTDASGKAILFNPYTKLIHEEEYLDMDAYAFSVDDAVGFMSELGSGLTLAVGGPDGLDNPVRFTYGQVDTGGFMVNVGNPNPPGAEKPILKSYGACELNGKTDCTPKDIIQIPQNSPIYSFRIGTMKSYPVKVVFTDINNVTYSFVVKENFSHIGPVANCKVQGPKVTPELESRWCESPKPHVTTDPKAKKDTHVAKSNVSTARPVNM